MEDVFAREEVAALKAQVKSAKSVVVTSHRSPDGDAIGSSLALKHMLSAMGVSSTVVMPDAYATFLHWMPGQDSVRFHDAEPEAVSALVEEADMLFCLDYNAPSRAGGGGKASFSVGDGRAAGLRQGWKYRGYDRPPPRA
ncbi:MAG: DHH family phosphoesterase [Flavobacteriales bacterium]|nr:DHH family phosphoesterase [Flavobacteriales bacterium]